MTYRPTEPGEAQSIGLCWLARNPAKGPNSTGLPDIPVLRTAVAQLHPTECGWCSYPRDELIAMLAEYRPMARAEAAWWAMPGKARLAAIRAAQGEVPA